MKLRNLFFLIVSIVIVVLNFIYGSIISYFISTVLVASLFYFMGKLGLEQLITKGLKKLEQDDINGQKKYAFVDTKWRSFLSVGLLVIVFVAACITVVRTTNPGINPWFLNNEYHAINNKAITFNNSLNLKLKGANDSLGRIQLIDKGNQQAAIRTSNFYTPILIYNGDGVQKLVNPIYKQSLPEQFTIKNGTSTLQIRKEQVDPNIFKRIFTDDEAALVFHITLQSTDAALLSEFNVGGTYNDQITIKARALSKGMSLYNLWLNAPSFESTKAESFQILENILLSFGETYCLADYSNEEQYELNLFPSRDFINNGYQLIINNQVIPAQHTTERTISETDNFYVGFNNYRYLMAVHSIPANTYEGQATASKALVFDYPTNYMLRSPVKEEAGKKNIRFITNDFEQIISDNHKEGFYFNNYNLVTDVTINGTMDYVSGRPNTPLKFSVTDHFKKGNHSNLEQPKFALASNTPGVNYLFEIRNFSNNGFAFNKVIFYLSIHFILFAILMVFFPGKKVSRIEPIILSVIFALLTLRYILYWRVATFPPLENISKYELESTLLNFDFLLFGFKLPLPLTLIWTILFVIGIIIYRRFFQKQQKVEGFIAKYFTNNFKIAIAYFVFLGICFGIYVFSSKVIHADLITRLITILIPLLGYCYFSILANKYYQYPKMQIMSNEARWKLRLKGYIFYFANNPTFLITLSTIIYFGVCDRGFAILFTLFILLKNIFLNFLKKPLKNHKGGFWKMVIEPNNYWIFGILSLIIYLAVLAYKPLFYVLITYKLWIILAFGTLSLIIIHFAYPQAKKLFKIVGIATLGFGLLTIIPFTHEKMDAKLNDVVKHVQYRASLIHQPISDLLQENEYSSFSARKIIETAENQWFINSYVEKDYDAFTTINLRPYTRVGVDYPTQTRDVVIARFVISEWGEFTMYLILLLFLTPLVLYLNSYRIQLITPNNQVQPDVDSYGGLIPLILLFTIALFVWLTATNRFVFFGQDFPFLSLTSKLSVLLPLMLYGIVLIQSPTNINYEQMNVRGNTVKYGFFFTLVTIFALTTVKENELNNKNFTIVMDTTRQHIDVDLNEILMNIQDSVEAKGKRVNYAQLINLLGQNEQFDSLKNQAVKDNYTKSVLEQLIAQPSTALKLNNPLFMVYDNGRYEAVYNKNLYLELPPIENRNIWNGSIQSINGGLNIPVTLLKYNNEQRQIPLPYFINDASNNLQFAALPASWFISGTGAVGILNVNNAARSATNLFIYKNKNKNLEQTATSFASSLNSEDYATIYKGKDNFNVSIHNAGQQLAFNKWINGKYKIIYPMRADNFWVYNFANAIKGVYSNDQDLTNNVGVTIDYVLHQDIQRAINNAVTPDLKKNRKYDFSVIGADGDGNIRFMNDYVSNRTSLDPNDEAAIYKLQQQQFFFSNAKNERDQWGNKNLLNLYLGPGSSIKPLFAALIASQVDAQWEQILLNPTNDTALEYYAGFKLNRRWKNDEHYRGPDLGIAKYIEVSSNYYQSILMFLGSYSRDQFMNPKDSTFSITNVLTHQAGKNNTYPSMNVGGANYYLPNIDTKKWPATDKNGTTKGYFGNENSLIANSFETNTNLRTKDKDKKDAKATTNDKVNFTDSILYKLLDQEQSGGFLWSFPEESYFLQKNRHASEIHQNFNLGLKTPTLGGYPYQLTPYKMLEMYLSMFTQNKNFRLQVVQSNLPKQHWNVDSTWGGAKSNQHYNEFLSQTIFMGMRNVISGANGTARNLQGIKAKYPGYHFYAKTGTINESNRTGKSSRRLIVTIANKDLTEAENIGTAKVYGLFFAVDNTGNFDWNLVNNIIDKTMTSASFQHYFNTTK